MNIGSLAPWYRWIEYCAFGRALEQARFAFFSCLKDKRQILILGEGDGRVLARVFKIAPEAQIAVVEASGEMIALARKRCGNLSRASFLQQDARAVHFSQGKYDAVLTCFFLDCFSEADARCLVHRLRRALAPGGIWLVSDFSVPESGWRHWHAKLWIWTMYRFFRVTTGLRIARLPPIPRLLQDAGMLCLAQQAKRAGLITTEIWQQDTTSASPDFRAPAQCPASSS